jgi:hypothetical protein
MSAAAAEIARNESSAIDLCRAYVEAQLAYFSRPRNVEGVLAFAERIRSTAGKHDGLYWPLDDDGANESPMGPNVAAAAITEQGPGEQPRPFLGYYFKTLLAQGPAAAGGARNFKVENRLVGGFALISWPAHYGVSGVQSYIVNHLGDVYARDLGPDTGRIAANVSVFNPDRSWTRVASVREEE